MRKFSAFLAVLLALCFVSSAAWAQPGPDGPQPSEHQRDIYWDFSVDPFTYYPGYGLNGAQYTGWADPFLWDSDYFLYDGGIAWDGYNEVIGIEGGEFGASGMAELHLDNLPVPNPVKYIDIYATVYTNLEDADGISFGLELPGGYFEVYGDEFLAPLGDGVYELYMWFDVLPNPEWEAFCLEVVLDPGEYVFLDDLHITTDCVPIPGAVWLLGSGLIGLVGLRRKLKS